MKGGLFIRSNGNIIPAKIEKHLDGRPRFAKRSFSGGKKVKIAAIEPAKTMHFKLAGHLFYFCDASQRAPLRVCVDPQKTISLGSVVLRILP